MINQEGLSRDCLRLFFWYPLRWCILLMPVRPGIRLLRRLGDLYFRFSRGKTRLLRQNLKRLPLKGAACEDEIIRGYFRNHYVDQLFILLFPRFTRETIQDLVEIEGLDRLKRCLERGNGVVFVHGHFGPVHLPLVVFSLLGYPMKQIGNPSDRGLSWIGRRVAYRLRMRYEGRIPAEIIKADGYLRPVYTSLRQNGIIMTTGDGTGTESKFGRQGRFSLFGQPVNLPLGPARLAEKTGAALLPLFVLPSEKKMFKIVIVDEFSSQMQGHARWVDITGKFAALLEKFIMKSPEYMHFLDRFHPGAFILKDDAAPKDLSN